MNMLFVMGIAFVAVIGAQFLRQASPEIAPFFPLAAIVLLLLAVFPQIGNIVISIQDLGKRAGIPDSSVLLVLRGVGIGLVTRVASGVCNDCGQRSLGETVDYCGQIAIVSLAVPLVMELAQRVSEMVI